MVGLKWLYISKECKVYKIPNPKNFKFKAIKELLGQDVLKVMLYYDTKDRKPDRLVLVQFERVTLDLEGNYELTDEKKSIVLEDVFQFIYSTPQELASSQEPLKIPLAPSIPTSEEKIALYEYLNEKYPILGKYAPAIIEKSIQSLEELHQKKINQFKEVSNLRMISKD